MSNYVRTTRTITNTEYDRLVSQARQASDLSSQVSALAAVNQGLSQRVNQAERAAQQTRAQLQAANQANAAKQEEFRTTLQNVIRDTDRRLAQAQEQHDQNMAAMKEQLGQQVVSAIEANNRNIQAAMDRNNQVIRSEIDSLRDATNSALDRMRADLTATQNTVDSMQQGNAALLSGAEEYHEQTLVVQGMIEALRHQMLVPGGYQAVQTAVAQAVADIQLARKNPMNSSMARNNARIAFESAFAFYEQVRNAEREWLMQLELAERLAEVVENQLENTRVIRPKPDKEYNVDEWTYGDHTDCQSTVRALREQLKDPDELTTQQLVAIQNSLRDAGERVEQVYQDAYVAISTSQNIVNEAERIHESMERAGDLRVVAHSYENSDQRSGKYRYLLRNNGSGLTVAVTVSVSRGAGISIESEADIVDYGTTSVADAERLVRGVLDHLAQNGPGAQNRSTPQCQNPGKGTVQHPERADMRRWQNGGESGGGTGGRNGTPNSTAATGN